MDTKMSTLIALTLFFIGAIIVSVHISFGVGKETGYNEGFLAGNASGFEEGNKTGFEKGFSAGKAAGYIKGRDEGFAVGREEGYRIGYSEGNETGYAAGRADGHATGHAAGKEEGIQQGYSSGYAAGLDEGIPHKYKLRDPTYSEAVEFLEADKTDRKAYIKENFEYVCIDYAIEVCRNAQEQNLDCHAVELVFREATGAHVIIAFNTIDRGWVYFEPQDDREVKVGVGVRYYRDNNYRSEVQDDTIIKVNIIP